MLLCRVEPMSSLHLWLYCSSCDQEKIWFYFVNIPVKINSARTRGPDHRTCFIFRDRKKIVSQWRIYNDKFSPLGPIFFIFMQFLGTFGWIIGWHPPPWENPGSVPIKLLIRLYITWKWYSYVNKYSHVMLNNSLHFYHHDIFNSSHLIIQTYHWAKLNDNVGTANLLFSSGNWICIEIGIARQVIIKHGKCILKHVCLNLISVTDGRLKLNVAVCLFCCETLFPFDRYSKDCLVSIIKFVISSFLCDFVKGSLAFSSCNICFKSCTNFNHFC